MKRHVIAVPVCLPCFLGIARTPPQALDATLAEVEMAGVQLHWPAAMQPVDHDASEGYPITFTRWGPGSFAAGLGLGPAHLAGEHLSRKSGGSQVVG
jgi:hypothetical protein